MLDFNYLISFSIIHLLRLMRTAFGSATTHALAFDATHFKVSKTW